MRLVRDSFGSTVLDNRFPQETEVVSAGTAYVMTSMLESVITEGTGYPNADIGRPAAGKTGTTSDFRDAWFVGYTPDLVTAVWLGNDDYTPMNESYGGNIPARTWARFMKAALAHTPKHEFAYPGSEVRKLAYCDKPSTMSIFSTARSPTVRARMPAGPERIFHCAAVKPTANRSNDAAAGAALQHVVGVKRLAEYLRRKLEGDPNLRAVRVRGEVSNLSTSPRGHCNFDLKEGDALLRCFAWAHDACRFRPSATAPRSSRAGKSRRTPDAARIN